MKAWLTCLLLLLAAPADGSCRLSLAMGLDVSGSVDQREYRLQTDGLAAALISPAVRAQILENPGAPIWIMVYEWAGSGFFRELSGWREMKSERDLLDLAAHLRAQVRKPGSTSTAIGRAMAHGAGKLNSGPPCWQRTLDLSSDGKNNDGTPPEIMRKRPSLAGITVNALVIGSDASKGRDERQMEVMELTAYFRRRVIHGPGAFTEVALGFEDFERAMTKKLLRETAGMAIGSLQDAPEVNGPSDRQQRSPDAASLRQ